MELTIEQQIIHSRLKNINFDEIDYNKDWLELAEQQQEELGYEFRENEILEREYDEIMDEKIRQYEEEEYMLWGI